MAALMLTVPPDTQRVLRELGVPGKPCPQIDHITVLMLGDEVSIEQLAEMMPVIYEACQNQKPFTVSTSQISSFPAGDDGVPVIAKIESPELMKFQASLKKELDTAQFDLEDKWPVYKPHVTLSYCGHEKVPNKPFPKLQWGVTSLTLWGADEGQGRLVIQFPLSLGKQHAGMTMKEMKKGMQYDD